MLRRIIAFAIGFTLMWGILGTRHVLAMGSTQFGTYSQAYLERQALKKCRAEARAQGRVDQCKAAPSR